MPERREEHHTLAATVGAMLFTVGGAGLIGLWMAAAGPHPSLPSSTPLFFPVLVALVVMVAVGLYMASTPWTGLPLRSPRAVGLLSDPQALVDPHTSTLKALNQIRTELSHAHQMIQAARAQGRYWPRLAEGHLSVKIWRQNRSHLQGTPGLRQLPHSLDVAYEQIRLISDIRGGR